jgi:hypothetical protein
MEQVVERLQQLRDELTVLQRAPQYLQVMTATARLEGEIKGLEWVLINIFKG